jgi:hypothetical protein
LRPSISEPDRLFLTDLFAIGKMSGAEKMENCGNYLNELFKKVTLMVMGNVHNNDQGM